MKRVMIESPYRTQDIVLRGVYLDYRDDCIRDSLERGEAPFASHRFYPDFLDDDDPHDRDIGMMCNQAWQEVAEEVAFYIDHGMSEGMENALMWANDMGLRIDIRSLRGEESP